MVNNQCSNCKYFNRLGDTQGECLRYPPMPYPLVQSKSGVVGGQPQIAVPGVLSFHPPVKEGDCCGEFMEA